MNLSLKYYYIQLVVGNETNTNQHMWELLTLAY